MSWSWEDQLRKEGEKNGIKMERWVASQRNGYGYIYGDLFEVCHPVVSIYFQPHTVFTDYTIPEVQVQAQGKAQERLEVWGHDWGNLLNVPGLTQQSDEAAAVWPASTSEGLEPLKETLLEQPPVDPLVLQAL